MATITEGAHKGAEIIKGEYFDSIVTGPPARPEPPKREPKLLDKKAIMKRQNWSEDQFDRFILRPGAPVSVKVTKIGSWAITLKWRDTDIDRTLDAMRAERDELNGFLGE